MVNRSSRDKKKQKQKHDKKNCWAQPKRNGSERSCSLDLCSHPVGKQSNLAIIFLGQGIHISAVE